MPTTMPTIDILFVAPIEDMQRTNRYTLYARMDNNSAPQAVASVSLSSTFLIGAGFNASDLKTELFDVSLGPQRRWRLAQLCLDALNNTAPTLISRMRKRPISLGLGDWTGRQDCAAGMWLEAGTVARRLAYRMLAHMLAERIKVVLAAGVGGYDENAVHAPLVVPDDLRPADPLFTDQGYGNWQRDGFETEVEIEYSNGTVEQRSEPSSPDDQLPGVAESGYVRRIVVPAPNGGSFLVSNIVAARAKEISTMLRAGRAQSVTDLLSAGLIRLLDELTRRGVHAKDREALSEYCFPVLHESIFSVVFQIGSKLPDHTSFIVAALDLQDYVAFARICGNYAIRRCLGSHELPFYFATQQRKYTEASVLAVICSLLGFRSVCNGIGNTISITGSSRLRYIFPIRRPNDETTTWIVWINDSVVTPVMRLVKVSCVWGRPRVKQWVDRLLVSDTWLDVVATWAEREEATMTRKRRTSASWQRSTRKMLENLLRDIDQEIQAKHVQPPACARDLASTIYQADPNRVD